MKRFLLFVLMFGFLGGLTATPVMAQDAVLCTATLPRPHDAKLDLYPLASRRLSQKQRVDMGLREMRLTHPFKTYNHHREINSRCGGSWVLEIIPAGEIVLVDSNGYKAYRESCGNRLIWAGPEEVVVKPDPKPVPTPAPAPPTPRDPRLRWWNRFWYGPSWGWWREVDIRPNGGDVEVTMGDIHIKANGNAEVHLRW